MGSRARTRLTRNDIYPTPWFCRTNVLRRIAERSFESYDSLMIAMYAAVKLRPDNDRPLKIPDLPADKEISDVFRLASHRRWEPHWHHPADIVGREELGALPL
jgi:hypothetical protein